MQKEITIPYGEDEKTFTIDESLLGGVYPPNPSTPLEDVGDALKAELVNPFCRSFFRRVRDRMRKAGKCVVAIVINDYTRCTPMHFILPCLLNTLNDHGVNDNQIKIIIALGTHRPMTEYEFVEAAGQEVLDRVGFINPKIDLPDRLVSFGKTASGVDVWIDRDYVEADFKIAIGSIIPHGAVGYSRGAKLMYPGISGRKTIEQFHQAANGNPLNYTGNLESPIREEIEKMAEKVGMDLLINLILNAENKICHITAGDFVKSHRKGAGFSREIYGVAVPSNAKIIIASSYHADVDFWQAAKTIFNCQSVVADDGWLIVVTPCPEGIPKEHASFDRYIGTPSERLQEMVRKKELSDLITASPAICLARFRERINIGIVSPGLTAEQVGRMGFHYFTTIEAALGKVVSRIEKRTVHVITHGGSMCPYVGIHKG